MDRGQRRVLLLATEPAAGLLLDDDDAVDRQAERPGERLVHVVRALEGAVDRDPAVLAGHGDHRLRLDVQLLLVPDPVRALDDEIGGLEARGDVAAADLVLRERMVRDEWVEDRRERLGAQADVVAGCAGERRIGRGDQGDGLGDVADLVRDQRRLVIVDQAHHVLAGDVRRGDHDDT